MCMGGGVDLQTQSKSRVGAWPPRKKKGVKRTARPRHRPSSGKGEHVQGAPPKKGEKKNV